MKRNQLHSILGLGKGSVRKNYYKDLTRNQYKLNQFRFALDNFSCPIVFFDPNNFKVIDSNVTFFEYFDINEDASVLNILKPSKKEFVKEELGLGKNNIRTSIISKGSEIPVELTIKKTSFMGKEIGICLIYDISERIKYEKKLEEEENKYRSLYHYAELSRKQLSAVLENSRTFAIAIDHSGKIIHSNTTQFPFKNYIEGMNVFKDKFPEEYSEIVSLIHEKGNSINRVITIINKGERNVFKLTAKRIGGDNPLGFLIYGHDITNHNEILRTLVDGGCYMHLHEQRDIVCQALEMVDYNVYAFSRNPKRDEHSFETVPLPAVDDPIKYIYDKVKELIKKKSIIYFDRFAFLLCFSDFSAVMRLVYRLNDLIRKSDSIILYAMPGMFTKEQVEYFRGECFFFSEKKEDLDPRKWKMLECLYSSDIALNCTQIGKKCSLSRKTVLNWAQELQAGDFIEEFRKGRSKYLKLTQKGYELFK